MTYLLSVLVQTPAHSQVAGPLTYRSEFLFTPGSLVRVPFGRRETLGVVWDSAPDPATAPIDAEKLRDVASALTGLPPLTPGWRKLVSFAAGYYQRSLGEVALAALPPQLRDLSEKQFQRRLQRSPDPATAGLAAHQTAVGVPVQLSEEQQAAIAAFHQWNGTSLLFGATGSGKTEIYLQCVQELLLRDPVAQAIVMVPEINLTPQLQARFMERFGPCLASRRSCRCTAV